MTHEPRLTVALRSLLQTQRVAALGTLDSDGFPFVSMVPFAVVPASAQPMTELGDIIFVGVAVQGARQVAGFGAARSLDAETMAEVLRPPH